MKKFKDIKTGTQLLIGFGLLIFLMLGLSILAWEQTGKLAKQTESLYNHPLQVRRALGKFETHIYSMQSKGRGLLLIENDKEFESELTLLEFNKTDAYRQIEILESRYLGPPDDIKKLREEFTQWNVVREETIRLLRQKNLKEATERHVNPLSISNKQISKLLEHISRIDNFAREKGDQFHFQAIQLNKDLNYQLSLFTAIAILISLLLAFYFSSLINQPLKEITRAVDSYRSGNKSARSKYFSKNQFGKLSESFNEAAESLETEYLISDKSSNLSAIMLKENDAYSFCYDMLKNLLEYTNSQMGAVYLMNDGKTAYDQFTCIGMDSEGCKPFSAVNPEGEFGLAIVSKKINHIKEIPSDCRFSFNTISGKLIPREIITIPIIDGDEAVAIISIFSIHSYSTISIRLVENIFAPLTARMNGVLAYKKIQEFTKKLKEQNIELETQKNELSSMADELKEQNAELEVQKHQLGEVSRLKTNFLSNMSHELRTPLNSVIALSSVLNRRLAKKIGEEEYSFLGVIERNGKHLLSLINDILDLARIEAGKVELDKNNFILNELLSEVILMIKPQALQKNIELNLYAEGNDIMLECDYNKLFHIFQNIIGNAVKFTEKGSVEVKVSINEAEAIVSVRDTGIGISKEELKHIFDEFRQADGSNSRKFGGTGLGLSIARKYAVLIGGDISVESEPGIGSIFKVRIPLKAVYISQGVDNISPEIFQGLPKSVITVKGDGKKILLVEDTEAMIVQITDILEAEGYSVDIARNGFEALELLGENIPDALVLDLMMPGMDGFELLNKIRSKKQTAYLPVLVLTAKILSSEELKVIKNNQVLQLIQKGRVTEDSLLEAIALLMLKKGEAESLKKIEIFPVKVEEKPVILAVEDNADNMLALKAIIEGKFEFIEATNGVEAIEQARKYMPHLILMDIAMTEMNGFEALKKIRKNEELKHIPVIVVTSSAMRGDKSYFLDFGFNGYVSKPVNPELLFEEIYKWLKIENNKPWSRE